MNKAFAITAVTGIMLGVLPMDRIYHSQAIPSILAAGTTSDTIVKLPFNNGGEDSSGNGNTGIIGNNVTFTDSFSGKAATFSGGKITLPKDKLSFGANQDFSISFWIKADPVDDDVIITNKNWDSGANQGWLIGIENNFLLWNWKGASTNRIDLKNQKKITVADRKWHHIAVTHDRDGQAKFYKDGVLEHVINIAGTGTVDTPLDVNIGADGLGRYALNNGMLEEFQIDKSALTQEQIRALYEEHKDAAQALPPLIESFKGKLELVGASHTVNGAQFSMNLHLRTNNMNVLPNKIETTLAYDSQKFRFVSASTNVTVDTSTPGILKVVSNGSKNFNDTKPLDFANTKIADLKFETIEESGTGLITVGESKFYETNRLYTIEQLTTDSKQITIHQKQDIDTNKDGLVTVADAIADGLSEDMKKRIAAASQIKPYKRVLFIGIDGCGVGVHERAPFWSNLTGSKADVDSRLQMPYLRSLIETGAVSYTAQAIMPTSSSPNWGAMFTGVAYDKHGISNTTSGIQYYPENSAYPTIFKSIREEMPERNIASYVNWTNITRGHIEPSLGVESKHGNDAQIAQQAKEFITNGKMKDTSLMFLHFDEVDGAGHSYGWYTQGFYNKIAQTDAHIRTVVEELDKQGLRDDTLILVMPDHGGGTEGHNGTYSNQFSHGQNSQLAKGIFFAANGRTVSRAENGEKILQGGTTPDAAATVLSALRLQQQEIGDSHVLEGMFTDQAHQLQKNAANLVLSPSTGHNDQVITEYDVKLKNQKSTTKAIDLQLATQNIEIKQIQVLQPGVKVLHQAHTDGKLRIILETKDGIRENESVIRILTKKHTTKEALHISEAVTANELGKEEMPNLVNEKETKSQQKPSFLQQATQHMHAVISFLKSGQKN
ncbi:alkaline phosphatase family protein [Ectobacillus sp. JY-23]|uniref:alkaline phosphatase family protein n=1 Tax=Ectobacillus sp. JY-23 TaxID=2933872 RepID=UPI001FF19ED6|nr:alkaline phosphatase family protein [Ectobacillus sp. JY-23]UOY93306.1 alkaline phosphatase family protein [Ectobacillus sp. JY-23]